MRELVVILEDLFSAPLPAGLAPPRLSALETLLARARREPLTQDWRTWLASHAGAAAHAPATPRAPAALLAHAWDVQCGAAGGVTGGEAGRVGALTDRIDASSADARGCWLATPVHLIAGIDRVLLHPAGLLRLAAAEQQRLVQQFAQVFAGSAWQLHARDARELLLTGPRLAASGRDPARFLGADPTAGLPTGPDAAPLRALGSELELWLHEHPLNRERAARGEPAVTTLWLWGGLAAAASAAASAASTASTVPTVPTLTQRTEDAPLYLYGSDTCAAALVRGLGGQCLPLPAGLASIQAPGQAARGVVLYPLRAAGVDEDQEESAAPGRQFERFERLERQWLAPALAALRAGSLTELLLVAADRVYHLDRRGWWRVWRARTAWWEVLGGTGSDAP